MAGGAAWVLTLGHVVDWAAIAAGVGGAAGDSGGFSDWVYGVVGVPGEHAEAAVEGGSGPTGRQRISSLYEMQIVLHLVAPNDNMIVLYRRFWLEQIKSAWEWRPVVWLAGVRLVGKTYLSQSLPDIEYFDCELPRIRRMLEDPQSFLAGLDNRTVVLDEIHRLPNPSELLKIAADHFPAMKVLATGSSTLGASAKFRDTLAARKAELRLTAMIFADLKDFQNTDLGHRFLFGGLPPFFMAGEIPERDF